MPGAAHALDSLDMSINIGGCGQDFSSITKIPSPSHSKMTSDSMGYKPIFGYRGLGMLGMSAIRTTGLSVVTGGSPASSFKPVVMTDLSTNRPDSAGNNSNGSGSGRPGSRGSGSGSRPSSALGLDQELRRPSSAEQRFSDLSQESDGVMMTSLSTGFIGPSATYPVAPTPSHSSAIKRSIAAPTPRVSRGGRGITGSHFSSYNSSVSNSVAAGMGLTALNSSDASMTGTNSTSEATSFSGKKVKLSALSETTREETVDHDGTSRQAENNNPAVYWICKHCTYCHDGNECITYTACSLCGTLREL